MGSRVSGAGSTRVERRGAQDLDQFKNRRQSKRTEMAEQGVALFLDGTRVPCIIHDISDPNPNLDAKFNCGMRVELLNVPNGKVPETFWILMQSGRVIEYSPGWTSTL